MYSKFDWSSIPWFLGIFIVKQGLAGCCVFVSVETRKISTFSVDPDEKSPEYHIFAEPAAYLCSGEAS